MEIKEGLAEREDLVIDKRSDLLGDRAVGIAREAPVEVEAIDRRCPTRGHHRMDVDRWQQDDPALDFTNVEISDQLTDDDWSLVLVAVIAAFDDHRGTTAICQ